MKTRREFIKDACTSCLAAGVLGVTLTQLATACSSLPIYKISLATKSAAVPLTSFAESNLVIVRDMQVAFDILVVKKSPTEYIALYMKCTHQENAVSATATGLFCSAHGSRFDLDGNVVKEPALSSLKRFQTELSETHITVSLNS